MRNLRVKVMQHKNFTAALELKHVDEDGTFEGYASVFGIEDLDGDIINKGAFDDSITKAANGKMPKMLWQHNPSIIIGKFTDIKQDEKGLFIKGKLITEVEKGREAHILMKEQVLDAMSVGFNITEGINRKGGGIEIKKLDLWEISIVTWGANPEALISNVKSITTTRNFERFLRDSGFSKQRAITIASNGFSDTTNNRSDSDLDIVKGLNDLIKTMEI